MSFSLKSLDIWNSGGNIGMIQDIEPQRFNNQYSNRREPEDHDMVLSFSEKMIFAKVMDDENLLEFMTYGELQKITGCDMKIADLI